MKISLKNRKALVGGSTSGIGKAIAQQLAASGASVTLMARNEEKLRAMVSELPTSEGRHHQYLVVDFNDFTTYQEIITSYFKANSVDILVNNTQGPPSGGALEKNIKDYQQAFDLLFKTVVLTTELALHRMIENKWGRIINVASVSVKEPLAYLTLSNTIRAAVTTWAKTLATDVAQHQITVNNILTGYFDTERIHNLNEIKARQLKLPVSEVISALEDQVPMKRIGDPVEYGYLATFLASDHAAYLTGTNIPLDGGLLKSL
ncbi:SDR family oxidoreductase [Flavobacteriaceae bacterium F89]|uniref:SDR family oxidoreductase n=1 Tax=Cerina litoralis TaxID=2874477 RepID=A0AAE3JTR8_9FLAO|nr:SDR family oxidoreductase [Cerina litoralis]MCG2461747.1 SDR family oxidoreductase [Cerina litoralis]